MKKLVFLLIVLIIIVSFAFGIYAFNVQSKIAENVHFQIRLNGEDIDAAIPMVKIEDQLYMQPYALVDFAGIDIAWTNEESTIEITVAKNDTVEIGYEGIEEWNKADLKITKETAMAIADAVLLQQLGKEFIEQTVAGARESNDGMFFVCWRVYDPLVRLGGNYDITIRKSDGKIMQIITAE